MKIQSDTGGKGRSYVFMRSGETDLTSVAQALSTQNRCIDLIIEDSESALWKQARDEVRKLFTELSIRQATYVAIAQASNIALALALQELKSIRSLILIDPQTRPIPSWGDQMIGKIEQYLPLGLPFRTLNSGFDCKPFLQRIRCPVMLLSSKEAGLYQKSEFQVFLRELPSAWGHELVSEKLNADYPVEVARLIQEFQDIPTKCPQ